MSVPINNVTRRVVYAASGTGPYNFSFEILAATDIAVYRDDTLLTLTTDYTVTINANGTGSVTLTATPTGATQIAIVGNRTIQRLSDFVTGGDFFANTLNDELDQQTIFAQQNAEGLGRALQAPISDPSSINMTLPAAATRATKYLGFDASGNPAALPGTGTASVINLATDVTGVLQPANGGTGSTTSTGTGAVVLAASPTISTLNLDGNLNITGSARRITGDFSNATFASRVMFQSSTTNGNTGLGILPNGTATSSVFTCFNNSDPTNSGVFQIAALSTDMRLNSGLSGTGTALPMTFYTSGVERVRIDTSGNVGIGNTPSVKLDVQGAGTIRGFLTTTDAIKLGANTSAPTTTDAFIYRPADNTIALGTGSTERMRIDSSGNFLFGGTSTPGQKVIYIANATSVPIANPSGGGVLYVESGALKYRGSSGTVTTIANA
jgi:hypothetical protein